MKLTDKCAAGGDQLIPPILRGGARDYAAAQRVIEGTTSGQGATG